MKRVLIIGIDSLDRYMLKKFEDDLPNFSSLRGIGQDIEVESVFPPDSPTCWASIYTGLNPAKHSILGFLEPLKRIAYTINKDTDNSSLRGKTFWDIAGSLGKQVCVILPCIGYPVWPVNGIMVGRSSVEDSVQVFPKALAENRELSQILGIRSYPIGRMVKKFIADSRELTLNEAEFGLKLFRSQKWDLFFISLASLDAIQGFFWKFCDEEDPTYPGDNQYKNVIKDFYRLLDEILGKFLEATDRCTVTIVVSDHGMGMRPTKLLNVNELLREKGLLVPRFKGLKRGGSLLVKAMEKVKRLTSQIITNNQFLAGIGGQLLQIFPPSRKIYTTPFSIDWRKTVAYFTDFSGIKAYSYGGVCIQREYLGNKDYEDVRNLIIEELSTMIDPDTGDKITRWVRKREELYSGEYISLYPDIVLYLKDDYGGGWAIYESIVSTSPTHKIVSGGHRAYRTTFLMSDVSDKKIAKRKISLVDIAPTVLDILDIGKDFRFDGRSIFIENYVK
ncbi:MAG: alkaline phosphatase family protein [Candidatus Hodarchaeota archaeon]